MVHDHEEGHPNARKRSYPFIQWVNPGSSPPRKKSPDRDKTDESFPPSLPSPPLQSNKYKIFKQDLDRFGGRLKPQQNNGLGRADNGVKVEEKPRVRKTSWAEATTGGGKDCERILCSKPKSHCPPSPGEPVTKVSKLKTDVSNYKKGYSEFSQTSEKKKKEKHVVHKARENEMHVSSSGQDYDADSVKSASFDEDEPQATKRPKYSVEIREVAAEEEEEEREYRPNIAESIKLRKPSESRRNKSESYDESDARTIKKILSSTSILDDKKSSLTNNCRLTNRISSQPYIKKSASPAMTGTKIKMIPRSSLLHPSLESTKEGGSENKVYNIQIPQTNGSNGGEVHASKDRNHNKVKDNGYDSRKVTISNIAGEVKYKKASLPQPRPSSTVVSSSTEVNNDEETEEDDEHDGHDDSDKEQQSSGDSGRVGLQSSGLPNGGYGLGSRPYWPQHKDRPTPYSRDNHNGHSLKQVCRIKKFNTRYPAPEKPRQKRAVIQDMVRPLKQWLLRHRHNPYPTKGEKVQLAVGSNMTLVQVSNWFANARRRLKNVVQETRCSWSKRLRLYNQFVQGNAELLSISSDDSIWNSGDEDDGEKSDTGNTDDFEETVPGIIDEHSYTIVPGEGRHLLGSDSDGGQGGLEIDLPRETCSPRGEGSGSGVTSPRLSQGSDSPTGSESPACSLPDNDNIPDAKKYKNRMLARYLNDAEEAQWHNNRKNSQGTTAGDFSSEDGDVVYPDQSNLSAGVQENGVGASVQEAASTTQRDGYDSPPTLLPQTEQWQPVDGNLIPTPSNNITISFTHLPLEKDLVPVLTQPPRDNMGVDKVKRQLDLRSDGEGPTVFNSAPNQTVYVSLPTVPLSLPSEQFSTTGGPPYSIKSEGGRSNSSSPISSVSSPNKVFPSQSLRPPFIGSILPGPFPFYPGGPLNGWHFPVGPVPFPHFLHLAPPPDPSSCPSDAPPPRLTPPPWPGGGPASTGGSGSPTWRPPPAGPSQVPPPTHSHPRWDEMEAARALSQLASSPVSGPGSLAPQTAPPPCT